MFAASPQPALVSLFSSTGSNPLQLFSQRTDLKLSVDSFIHLLHDASSSPPTPTPAAILTPPSLRSVDTSDENNVPESGYSLDHTVLHIQSPTIRTTYIQCPPHRSKSTQLVQGTADLGLTLPYMHVQVRNLAREWAFEVGVVDRSGRRGIVRCSTFQKEPRLSIPSSRNDYHAAPVLQLPLAFPSRSAGLLTAWATVTLNLPEILSQFSILARTFASQKVFPDDEDEVVRANVPLPGGMFSHTSYIKCIRMVDHNIGEAEDIMHEGLALLGEPFPVEDDVVRYGPLWLNIAPKEGKANTLLADHLFSPALLLAERIERGLLPLEGRSVIELGAGCGLPSLLAAMGLVRSGVPKLVVATDYPAAAILSTLEGNIAQNHTLVAPGCTLRCHGFEWGTSATHIMGLLPQGRTGFDVMILSDLLHFRDAHEDLVSSICVLLAREQGARVYAAAGRYTSPEVCAAFSSIARQAGLVFSEIILEDDWEGEMEVGDLDTHALANRKRMCRMWEGQWNEMC